MGFWLGKYLKKSYAARYENKNNSGSAALILSLYPMLIPSMSLVLTYPLTYARIRLANNGLIPDKEPQFKGILDVWQKTYQADRMSGIYRGMGALMIGNLSVGLFSSFLQFMKFLHYEFDFHAYTKIMAVFVFPLVQYPFVTLSRRFAMTSIAEYKYKGIVDGMRTIIRK